MKPLAPAWLAKSAAVARTLRFAELKHEAAARTVSAIWNDILSAVPVPTPTWKLNACEAVCVQPKVQPLPTNSGAPAHWAWRTSLSICVLSCLISSKMAARSSTPKVSLAAWVALVFILVRMSLMLFRCPSATVMRDLASAMLASTCPRPLALKSNLVAMVRPAASSAAELMRLPVDRRSWATPSLLLMFCSELRDCSAAMLVAMRVKSAMVITSVQSWWGYPYPQTWDSCRVGTRMTYLSRLPIDTSSVRS